MLDSSYLNFNNSLEEEPSEYFWIRVSLADITLIHKTGDMVCLVLERWDYL